ncbi:MAG: 3'(2'),5'-bisphosphate nucleotidase CysQ [bacterium]|nr:3'(2'),5'-bisphosphate nucleotidase CysQ [bacterium]
MEKLLETAIKAAIDAGIRIMEIYDTDDFGVDFKSDNTPLTRADIASHNIIMSYLKDTKIPVLSEEGRSIPYEERKNWNRLWIVDPIDGTKEFIKRNGEFTVNIALIENQRPIAGVVLVPALGELYFSSTEVGSFKTMNLAKNRSLQERISDAELLPLAASGRPYTVVASRSHLTGETAEFIQTLEEKHGEVATLSKGSSLKLCMVAEGSADAYPRFAPTMEWDTAAGQAICNHSGCTVINWDTKQPLLYNRAELLNPWFLVEREK